MINNCLRKLINKNNFKITTTICNNSKFYTTKRKPSNKDKINIDENSDEVNPLYLDLEGIVNEKPIISTDQPIITPTSELYQHDTPIKVLNFSLNNKSSKYKKQNNKDSNNNNNNNKESEESNNNIVITTGKIELIGNRIDQDIETQIKPDLYKLFKKLKIDYPTTSGGGGGKNTVSDLIIDSLTHFPSKQKQVDQNKLTFFGELCFRHAISDPVEFSFRDKLLFEEFRDTVKSQYFLRQRCIELGISEFIRFSYHSKYQFYQSIYEKHYAYRCLIKFIGALYLETNFATVRSFIHKQILQQPQLPLESFILNKPESILIKNFSTYKLESPIIKTFAPKHNFPFYTTIIRTGTAEVSRAYGITNDESYNYAIEVLNKKSGSFTDLMSMIISPKK